jgi:hypothetical protein
MAECHFLALTEDAGRHECGCTLTTFLGADGLEEFSTATAKRHDAINRDFLHRSAFGRVRLGSIRASFECRTAATLQELWFCCAIL